MPVPGLRRVPLGAAIFLCLLAVSLVVGILVLRARTPDLVLEVTDPPAADPAVLVPGGDPDSVAITFFVREGDDDALIGIVNRREDLVRTLDADVALTARAPVTYDWDGRDDQGAYVEPGRYRLAVDLPSEDRRMIWPRRITVLPEDPE